jgi:hypothetical protein
MKTTSLSLLGLAMLWIGAGALAAGPEPLPEPGPENGGLRLRLVIRTLHREGQDTHHVRLDLVNVTEQPIPLTAAWVNERDKRDFKDYVQAAVSFETYPRIYHEACQMWRDPRKSPQPQYVLESKETLSIQWENAGNRLRDKDRVIGSNATLNPSFPVDGLYAGRAVVTVRASGVDYLLRSNEQQVRVGGRDKTPRHTCGRVFWTNAAKRAAGLDLGSLQGVKVGGRFVARTGMAGFWRLTIGRVGPQASSGTAVACDGWGEEVKEPEGPLPRFGGDARLVTGAATGGAGAAASLFVRPVRGEVLRTVLRAAPGGYCQFARQPPRAGKLPVAPGVAIV